jgi:hypothetical protein
LKLFNVGLSEPETPLQLSTADVNVAQLSVVNECGYLIGRHLESAGSFFQGQQHIAPDGFVDPGRPGRGGSQDGRVRVEHHAISVVWKPNHHRRGYHRAAQHSRRP